MVVVHCIGSSIIHACQTFCHAKILNQGPITSAVAHNSEFDLNEGYQIDVIAGSTVNCQQRETRWLDLARASCSHTCGSLRPVSTGFHVKFMVLNIINFADIARRENDRVSWDVKRVSSP